MVGSSPNQNMYNSFGQSNNLVPNSSIGTLGIGTLRHTDNTSARMAFEYAARMGSFDVLLLFVHGDVYFFQRSPRISV